VGWVRPGSFGMMRMGLASLGMNYKITEKLEKKMLVEIKYKKVYYAMRRTIVFKGRFTQRCFFILKEVCLFK
jgi:hypothetical protein